MREKESFLMGTAAGIEPALSLIETGSKISIILLLPFQIIQDPGSFIQSPGVASLILQASVLPVFYAGMRETS